MRKPLFIRLLPCRLLACANRVIFQFPKFPIMTHIDRAIDELCAGLDTLII